MPHVSPVLLTRRPITKFTNYRYVDMFNPRRPAVLKNEVSSKGAGKKGKQCLQEMSLMLVCLQNNDYLENSCSKEIKAFNSCLQEFEDARKARAEAEAKGIMVSARGQLSTKQVNSMMKKWPQDNGNIKITR